MKPTNRRPVPALKAQIEPMGRWSSILLFAILFIAINIIPVSVRAQFTSKNGISSVVTTEQVRAELIAYAPQGIDLNASAASSNPVWVGLQLTHQPQWHTYWKNSGDSGQPTTLEWTLPVGVMASDIAWPLPKKIPIADLANYGYEGAVLLPVQLTFTPGFKPPLLATDIDITLKAAWLACKRECIPQEGEFTLKLPIKSSTALHTKAFQAAFDAQPKDLTRSESGTSGATGTSGSSGTSSQIQISGNALQFTIAGLPTGLHGKTLELFPETSEVIETAANPTQSWQGAVWQATVPLSNQRTASPARMPVVLIVDVNGLRQGYRTDLAVNGSWPATATAAGVSPALQSALNNNASSTTNTTTNSTTLWTALIGALLGGLILNLMPCVFPVLAIKVVGFTRHASDRRAHAISGMAYTAGVVLSFVALGALMLALRAAGVGLGWGFQLQSPLVVAVLAALFTVIGLNLSGMFEFGSVLPSGLASLQASHPVVDSFLTGVLAVAVASPCTAPFMGASLGFAIGLPAWKHC